MFALSKSEGLRKVEEQEEICFYLWYNFWWGRIWSCLTSQHILRVTEKSAKGRQNDANHLLDIKFSGESSEEKKKSNDKFTKTKQKMF